MLSNPRLWSSFLMLCVATSLLVAGFAGTSYAAPVTIDDFIDSQWETFTGIGTFDATEYSGSMIGGKRDVRAIINSNPLNLEVRVKETSGIMVINTDANVDADIILTWDGSGTPGGGLNSPTGVDLTDSGTNTQLGIKLLSTDHPVDFLFTVTDVNGYTATAPISAGAAGVYTAPFGSFSKSNVAFSFASVSAIKLSVTSPAASEIDTVFDLIDASAPEPSSILLLSLGFGGLGIFAYGRRRRRNEV